MASARDRYAVVLVDDDASVRDSLALVLSLRGYSTRAFASAEDCLAAADPTWEGCIVADLKMPGMGGLDLAARLAQRGLAAPFVVITAHGDVASARAAFRLNVVDFLEKPFDDDQLVDAIEAAFAREDARIAAQGERDARERSLEALSPREREIAQLVASGLRNAAIAQRLDISPRTVEVHKARVMEKLGLKGLDELIRKLRPPA
ncbi:MAG TPA: response regulator [Casimicrobiaceae bacterium]|jgi:RNA polymerase sigma factor (sigma-70 family)